MCVKQARAKEALVGKRLFRLLATTAIKEDKKIEYGKLVVDSEKLYKKHANEKMFIKMSFDFHHYGFEHVKKNFEIGTYLMK